MKFLDLKYFLAHWRRNLRSFIDDWIGRFSFSFKPREIASFLEKKIFPERLYFEVTNNCNARCVFCAYKKIAQNKERKTGFMSFATFKKGIDEFKEAGGRQISLTPTLGEPLLDRGIAEKIAYAAKEAKLEKVYLFTNGILMGQEENYKELIEAGIHRVEISTQGCDRDLFKKLYGVDLYEQFLRGLELLLSYNKERGEPTEIRINFRSALKPSKVIETDDFQKTIKPFLSDKVKYDFLVDYDNWGGVIKKTDLIGVMKLARLPRSYRFPCRRLFDASILFDGSVRLCACRAKESEFDELVVGNIQKNTLEKILFGKRVKKIRRGFLKNRRPLVCQACSFYRPAKLAWLKAKTEKEV